MRKKYGKYLTGLSAKIKKLEDIAGAYKAIKAAAIQSARALNTSSKNVTDEYSSVYGNNMTDVYKSLREKFGKKKADTFKKQLDKKIDDDQMVTSSEGLSEIVTI